MLIIFTPTKMHSVPVILIFKCILMVQLYSSVNFLLLYSSFLYKGLYKKINAGLMFNLKLKFTYLKKYILLKLKSFCQNLLIGQ